MLRRLTDFILQSRLQAMGVALIVAFIPIVGSLSVVIAAFVTLRKNVVEGFLVLLAASLPICLSLIGYSSAGYSTSFSIIILTLLVSNLLTWVLAIILRQYSSWSLILQVTTLLGVIVVVAVHLMFPDVQNWWATQLTDYFVKTLKASGQIDPDQANPDNALVVQVVGFAKQCATGYVVAFIALNAVMQLMLARWWQAVIYNPGGLHEELYQIRMGYAVSVLFAITIVMSRNALSIDILPVFYLTFGLAGISLAHCLFAKLKFGWFRLALLYIAILLAGMAPVAWIALFDTWFDFRKRFKAKST